MMRLSELIHKLWIWVFVAVLAGCGGGEDSTLRFGADSEALVNNAKLWSPAPGATPASGNYVYLQSDAGDYIGQGKTYTYTQKNALLKVTSSFSHLAISVNGDQIWNGDFLAKNSTNKLLRAGYYGPLQRFTSPASTSGGLNWSGDGRGCNTLTGWFVVDKVTYSGSTLTSIELRFEQNCENGRPALHGKIRWSSNDTTAPSGPVNPPPANLWAPAAGTTPASGNYVYLQSDAGDYIGGGQTYTYTRLNSNLSVNANAGHLAINVNGNQTWTGEFQAMNVINSLQPGYYGSLKRYPFHNPILGGLNWSGNGRGCNTLSGWFVVDSVTYVSGALTAIDLRFEQHCEGGVPALRGKIHWSINDTTAPSGPVNPPPADLWAPAAGTTPSSGNYVYLQSDAGDYIGGGQTYTYTPLNATLSVNANAGHLAFNVNGNQTWTGNFKAMDSISTLQPGYYGSLQRYPFHNPTSGGLDWSGDGRGCNTLTGWFVVDNVTYVSGVLTAIDLRFEQHCEGGGPALHGKIRWSSNDTTAPSGPVNPPPANLWAPAAGTTPASGNYVYLQSDAGDYIGGGQTYTYTPQNGTISVTANAGYLRVNTSNGGNDYWMGDFKTMNTISTLQPGYYGSLQRYPFHNPTFGGLSWAGNGRGCNTLSGWFVVDSVTYVSGVLTAIDLRFEQHCEGGVPALRGKIHWVQ